MIPLEAKGQILSIKAVLKLIVEPQNLDTTLIISNKFYQVFTEGTFSGLIKTNSVVKYFDILVPNVIFVSTSATFTSFF